MSSSALFIVTSSSFGVMDVYFYAKLAGALQLRSTSNVQPS